MNASPALATLPTPTALLDEARMQRNIQHMPSVTGKQRAPKDQGQALSVNRQEMPHKPPARSSPKNLKQGKAQQPPEQARGQTLPKLSSGG